MYIYYPHTIFYERYYKLNKEKYKEEMLYG